MESSHDESCEEVVGELVVERVTGVREAMTEKREVKSESKEEEDLIRDRNKNPTLSRDRGVNKLDAPRSVLSSALSRSLTIVSRCLA